MQIFVNIMTYKTYRDRSKWTIRLKGSPQICQGMYGILMYRGDGIIYYWTQIYHLINASKCIIRKGKNRWIHILYSSVQCSSSVMSNSLRPHGLQHTRLLLLKPCPSSQRYHPTISSSLILPPSIFPSLRVFSNESVHCIRWPKYWSFSYSISPSNEYSGMISFRIDWLDLLAVQVTLKSLLQHHSSKASFLQHSVFFIVQLSHPYMTTGKTIALTRRTFVGKVMCLLFNMLSGFVIAFLPTCNCLLISWLQSPSAVILELNKIKSSTLSTVSSFMCHKMMGPNAMILVF